MSSLTSVSQEISEILPWSDAGRPGSGLPACLADGSLVQAERASGKDAPWCEDSVMDAAISSFITLRYALAGRQQLVWLGCQPDALGEEGSPWCWDSPTEAAISSAITLAGCSASSHWKSGSPLNQASCFLASWREAPCISATICACNHTQLRRQGGISTPSLLAQAHVPVQRARAAASRPADVRRPASPPPTAPAAMCSPGQGAAQTEHRQAADGHQALVLQHPAAPAQSSDRQTVKHKAQIA